ncbi:MAG: hypothetical protein A3E79_10635 [Burkholderiales bacterium RIFCSPHIGHO2_12_FULL_61_11]|nr:MAG: hypothetical protein A3E79_10635 [Burkholderiales bacterium RIFCSPHIGHO2_12_FULL_61_11]
MLNCQDATRLLSESQERALPLKERLSLKMHVMMCSGCRNFGQQMDILRQIARAYVKGENEGAGEEKDKT